MRLSFPAFLVFVLLLIAGSLHAQTASLYGKVTTRDGQPVKYINVVVLEEGSSALTREDGSYEISNIKPGNWKVQASFTGLKSSVRTAAFTAGNQTELNFMLEENYKEIDAVVIEATRIMNKAASTANKLPVANLESPQIVNNISDVVLRKQNAMNLEDALKNAPGVTKLWDATSRPDGGSIFVSRGFQTVTKARNGLPNTVNTNVDMVNLDRIEVIKGPSATLFGNVIGSYGGIINRVTKTPHFYNDGMVDLSYGSYNFMRAAADLNQVLIKDRLAMRLNVGGMHQESWQDQGFQESLLIAPSFLYKPNSRFAVHLDAEFNNTRGNSNGGNFIFVANPSFINAVLTPALRGAMEAQGASEEMIEGVLAQIPRNFKEAFGTNKAEELPISYNRSFLNNDIYATTGQNTIYTTATYKFNSNWTSQTSLTYGRGQNKGYTAYQYLFPNYLSSFINTLTPGTAGADSIGRMVWNPVGKNRTYNIQQNFISDYRLNQVRFRTVLGLDAVGYKSKVTYNRFQGMLFNAFPYVDVFDVVDVAGTVDWMDDFTKGNVLNAFANRPNSQLVYDDASTILAAYLNTIVNLGSYAVVSAGLRGDHFRNDIDKTNQTKWSPKFGLILMPVKDRLSIFGNYQHSFTNQFGSDKEGRSFMPEDARQKEAGIKYQSLSNKVSGSISYYHILVDNIVRQDPTDPMFSIQDGAQLSRGIELDLSVNPVKGWTLLGGYGYNDSKMTRADADVEGLRPVGSGPYHSFNFWTNYSFTEAVLQGLSLGLSINHAGRTNAFNLRPDGALTMPAYTVLGTHINYDTKAFRFALKCNNLTNERYWMGWSNLIAQMPRQWIGTVSYKF
ncbi:TonB-dependent receptor [Niabella terrae]